MKNLLLFLAGIAVICHGYSAAPVTLFKDGKSQFQIVLPDHYDNPGIGIYLKEAAQRLQDAIREASGAELPIVSESKMKANQPAILLGKTDRARQAGFNPESYRDFQGIIAIRDGNIYILGNDRHGKNRPEKEHYRFYILASVKALTVFMEDYLGTRFVMPGEAGTTTPQADEITLPADLDREVKPRLNYAPSRQKSLMYDYSNNGFGLGAYHTYGGHSYYDAVPREKYEKSHPEYFILYGGRRHSTGGHLCISNPEVQELIYQEMLLRLDDGAEVVQLNQTDGYIPCQCENCCKFGDIDDQWEKLWILHRSLAERLLKDRPRKKVQILGSTPPKSFREFPSNVIIELSKNSEQQFVDWRNTKVPGGFTVYIHNWDSYPMPGMTAKRTPKFVAKQVRGFMANGIKGIYRCGFGECMGMESPTYYVFGKMIDDPAQDPAKLEDEFYRTAFGESAGPMREFYQPFFKRLEAFSALGSAYLRDSNLPSSPRILLAYIYSPDLLDRMEKSLTRAEKKAVNPKVKKRLELVRFEFNYAKNLGNIMHLYNAYRTLPDQAAFDRLAPLIEERNAILDRTYDQNGKAKTIPGWREAVYFGGQHRSRVMNNGWLSASLGAPLTWDIASLRQHKVLPGANIKKMTIVKAAGEVAMDNFDFETGAWSRAEWHELGSIQMGRVTEKTRFKIIYGKEHLYLGFVADLPAKRQIVPLGADGRCWREDDLEIFVNPRGDRENYYHFAFNPVANSWYDSACGLITDTLNLLYGKADPDWNGQWKYNNKRSGDQWYAVMKISFASFAEDKPESGSIWTLNIARKAFNFPDPMQAELQLWSPNFETMSFHDREAFGEAVFE